MTKSFFGGILLLALSMCAQAQRTPVAYDSSGVRIGSVLSAVNIERSASGRIDGWHVFADDGYLLNVRSDGSLVPLSGTFFYDNENCDSPPYLEDPEVITSGFIWPFPPDHVVRRDRGSPAVTLGHDPASDISPGWVSFNGGCFECTGCEVTRTVYATTFFSPDDYRLNSATGFNPGAVEIRLEQSPGIFCSGFECSAPVTKTLNHDQ